MAKIIIIEEKEIDNLADYILTGKGKLVKAYVKNEVNLLEIVNK